MKLLEFFNQNSGAFAVIFSAIVAIATAVYAFLTWKLFSETKKMREAQTEPKVSIVIQPRKEWISLIDMVIQNIGLGPAYDIKFNVSPDFEYAKGKFLSNLGFMKNGLQYLAPNQKIEFFLTSMTDNYKEKIINPFKISLSYQNSIGKTYKEEYLLDFSHLIGLSQLSDPLYNMSKNIENIEKDIHNLATGFFKMKVIRYTNKDIEEEEKRMLRRINKNNILNKQ